MQVMSVYLTRQLHQRIEEHNRSAVGHHLKKQHDKTPGDIAWLEILDTHAQLKRPDEAKASHVIPHVTT